MLAFVLATPLATMTKCLAEVILWKTDAAGLVIQQEVAREGVAGVETAQLQPECQEKVKSSLSSLWIRRQNQD